jgi:hypothetical protein
MYLPYLNIAGLVLSLIGVLILFRYGMPFAIPMHGYSMYVTEQADPATLRQETLYKVLGYIGLFSIVIGTAFQIVASLS